jgi:inner membrane protein
LERGATDDNDMTGITHIALGLTTLYALRVAPTPQENIIVGAVCVLGSLAPDLDHPNAMLTRKLGCVGWLISGVLRFFSQHRGITHSVWFAVAVSLAAWQLQSMVMWSFAVGYIVHIIGDMFTHDGVLYLLPLRVVVRSPLHILTGSIAEKLLLAVLVLAALWRTWLWFK